MKWHRDHEPSMWLRGEIARVRHVRRTRCEHLVAAGPSVLPVIPLSAPSMAFCSACWPPMSLDTGMPDNDHRCARCGAVDHHQFHALFTDVGWSLIVLGLCRTCYRREIITESGKVRS